MNLITIDFETYYDKDYSLSKITTQEYIQYSQFEVIGVGVKLNDQPTEWVTEGIASYLTALPWNNSMVVAHNAMFDCAILAWRYDIHPKFIFCTMQGSRPFIVPFIPGGRMSLAKVTEYLTAKLSGFIGSKGGYVANALGKRAADFTPAELKLYGEYCINDVELCYYIAKYLLPIFPRSELKLLHLNILKYINPTLKLDYDKLVEAHKKVLAAKEKALRIANIPDPALLRSNDKFAATLKLLGVTPPTKISPATGNKTYAFAKTDPGMIQLQEHDDPLVQAVVAARLKVKSTLEETRLKRFMQVAQSHEDAMLAVPLLYYGAHTGRQSGLDKMNLQNLSRGSSLREAITVPDGYVVVVGDLAQIEARIAACLAGQMDLVRAFANGEDVYCIFATRLYNREITEADYAERFVGKCTVLSCQYGVGAEKLHMAVNSNPNVSITEGEAARTVHTYRNVYFKLPELWKEADSWLEYMVSGAKTPLKYKCLTIHPAYKVGTLEECPAIILPNGMPLLYPSLTDSVGGYHYISARNGQKSIYGAAVVENVCQALARIVLSEAELRLAADGVYASNQVHDELVYVIPERDADMFTIQLESALTVGVDWMPELPVACEVSVGSNYKEAK